MMRQADLEDIIPKDGDQVETLRRKLQIVKEYSAKIQKSIRTRENGSIELLDEDGGSSMLRGLSQRVPYSPMVKS